MMIIHTKGSLERAKQRLDKLCTFRTTMPNLHGPYDVNNDFNDMFQVASLTFLPNMTEHYYRLLFFKGVGDTFTPNMYTQYFRYCRILRVCEDVSSHQSEQDMVNAPWYVRNEDIHRDLDIDFVNKIIKKHAESNERRLHQHVNVEAIQLLDNTDIVRRLKRTKPFEYLCEHAMGIDYFDGVVLTFDMREMNILNFLAHLNLLEFRQLLQFYFEGLGARIKGIHIISESKMIDGFVKLLQQVLSAKLGQRIFVHSTVESLYKEIPKELLPREYGGKEKTVLELREEFKKELGSEEFLAYMAKRDQFGVIETARMKDLVHTEHMGLPGTFRTLAVD